QLSTPGNQRHSSTSRSLTCTIEGSRNLERLWSPWRAKYIASGSSGDSESRSCVFCEISKDLASDEKNHVLHRGGYNFVVLNLYPYISGHLLIVPYDHIGELDAAPKEITDELMDLTKRSQRVLRDVYKP